MIRGPYKRYLRDASPSNKLPKRTRYRYKLGSKPPSVEESHQELGEEFTTPSASLPPSDIEQGTLLIPLLIHS